ncbi:MAG: hypothetical protein DRR16_11290, partial [Candidatus Parabeggiatoa sp. nov. 3]
FPCGCPYFLVVALISLWLPLFPCGCPYFLVVALISLWLPLWSHKKIIIPNVIVMIGADFFILPQKNTEKHGKIHSVAFALSQFERKNITSHMKYQMLR